MKFKIKAILHASFLIDDLERSLKFYNGILGMQLDHSRPEMVYPGAWLKLGNSNKYICYVCLIPILPFDQNMADMIVM